MTEGDVEQRVRRWLEEAVIGLDLCPFAASVYRRGFVHIATDTSSTPEGVIERVLDEAVALLEGPDDDESTTLVVCTNALQAFETFLDVAATVEDLLAEADAEGVLQVATFHPDYRFAGTQPDALENYTNRAPFPILHLLREAQVTQAVEAHPAPEEIPQKNIEKLESMGREEIDALWGGWSADAE